MRSRALVFDLYGEYLRYRGGAARLARLTRVMEVFGIEPATVRTVMTRLRREGWFDSTKSGREVTYALNAQSWRLLDNGRARIFDRPGGDWDRTWTQAIVDLAGADRKTRERIETALSWWGFGRYGNGVWFSPHDREERARDMLQAGDERRVQFLRCSTTGLSEDRRIAGRCWDLTDLARDYQEFVTQVRGRLPRYRNGSSGREALIERVRLIQGYRGYPFRDPDLPDVLLPPGWRGRVAHEVFLECHEALRPASEEFFDMLVKDV